MLLLLYVNGNHDRERIRPEVTTGAKKLVHMRVITVVRRVPRYCCMLMHPPKHFA